MALVLSVHARWCELSKCDCVKDPVGHQMPIDKNCTEHDVKCFY